MQQDLLTDPESRDIIASLKNGTCIKKGFTLSGEFLYFKSRLYVPNCNSWRLKLLLEFHDGPMSGHSGFLRTYKRLTRNFMWPGIKKNVKTLVAECDVCQRNHYEALSPPGLLQPIPIPSGAWEDISMDFIEGLPKTHGKTVIWVVIDRLTKFAHFVPLAHPYTAKTVAEAFVHEIFKLHGMPKSIISDRDPIFLSKLWEEFFKLQGTKLLKSSAYHPQTDV